MPFRALPCASLSLTLYLPPASSRVFRCYALMVVPLFATIFKSNVNRLINILQSFRLNNVGHIWLPSKMIGTKGEKENRMLIFCELTQTSFGTLRTRFNRWIVALHGWTNASILFFHRFIKKNVYLYLKDIRSEPYAFVRIESMHITFIFHGCARTNTNQHVRPHS